MSPSSTTIKPPDKDELKNTDKQPLMQPRQEFLRNERETVVSES